MWSMARFLVGTLLVTGAWAVAKEGVPPPAKKFGTAEAVKAQAVFTVAAARVTFEQALLAAVKSAMAAGNLPEANALNSVLTVLADGGDPSGMDVQSTSLRQAMTPYKTAMTLARAQYVTALKSVQKTVFATGNLNEANAIDAEISAINAPPANPSAIKSLNESADQIVSGKGFTMATLDEKGQAYGNRKYVWLKIPPNIRGWRYTKIDGGSKPEIKVRAKRDTIVEAVTNPDEPGLKMTGWERTGTRFVLSTAKKQEMVLYKMKLSAGQELQIPEGSWGGLLVLLPRE